MSLPIEDACPVEREVTLQSGVKGLEDRKFLVGLGPKGLTFREKGSRTARRIDFRKFASFMILHCPESET